MSNLPQIFCKEFEGKKLTTIMYKGQPVWLAGEVSLALGYCDQKKLANKITQRWADEFIEGKDFVKLLGAELLDFKNILGLEPKMGSSFNHCPNLILLTETGLNLALMKTRNPAGVRLRRFLADEVLPALTHHGSFSLKQSPRKKPADELKELADQLEKSGQLSEKQLSNLRITASEIASGADLTAQRPWLTAYEMAAELGVGLLAIHRAINFLELYIRYPDLVKFAADEALYSPYAVRKVAAVVKGMLL